MELKLGKPLNNGAILIALFGDKDWETNPGYKHALALNEKNEYVTWLVDTQGDASEGHYFTTFFSAVDDFRERTKNQVQIVTRRF
jgi:hypothetical protein